MSTVGPPQPAIVADERGETNPDPWTATQRDLVHEAARNVIDGQRRSTTLAADLADAVLTILEPAARGWPERLAQLQHEFAGLRQEIDELHRVARLRWDRIEVLDRELGLARANLAETVGQRDQARRERDEAAALASTRAVTG